MFFRDTQSHIKSQNPNATFGQISKIVAGMWDQLDAERKEVYKKKTEAAKKVRSYINFCLYIFKSFDELPNTEKFCEKILWTNPNAVRSVAS